MSKAMARAYEDMKEWLERQDELIKTSWMSDGMPKAEFDAIIGQGWLYLLALKEAIKEWRDEQGS